MINYSLYLFGIHQGAYIQYPADGEETLLRPLCSGVKGSRLTIHRKDALIHYAFQRQLSSDSSEVFGLCLVTNGVYIKDIKVLYQSFDKIFSRIVLNGKILKLDGKGKISYGIDNFASNTKAIEQIEVLVGEIVEDDLETYILHTRQNYSGVIGTKEVTLEERNSEILNLCDKYNNVHITVNGEETSSINYVEQTISRLYKENRELKANYSKLMAQKKQYRNVVFLILAVLACGVGLLFLNDSLNTTQGELQKANEDIEIKGKTIQTHLKTIEEKKKNISILNGKIDDLQSALTKEQTEHEKIVAEYEDFKEGLSYYQPIIITNIEVGNADGSDNLQTSYGYSIYSSSSMYLKPRITYKGMRDDETITLYVRLYTPEGTMSRGSSSPSGYSYSQSLYVNSGSENTYAMKGWGGSDRGHWSKGSYRFEIWYGNMCLKAKTFTVY